MTVVRENLLGNRTMNTINYNHVCKKGLNLIEQGINLLIIKEM